MEHINWEVVNGVAAFGTVFVACCILVLLSRPWGKARKMQKEIEDKHRLELSKDIRRVIEAKVSGGKWTRTQADEWLRRFGRMQLPDMLPPQDPVKVEIQRRIKSGINRKPALLVDRIDWKTWKPKEIKPKKNLIAAE